MDQATLCYQRFLKGEESALVELIRDYRDGLMLYINGIVSDLSVAEELTEDTFLKLVLKKPRFSARCSFKTWLYTIGRNLALDYLRRNRRSTVCLEDCPLSCDEAYDLEQQYIQQENQILLHQAMKKLKPEYRQVLWLVYFEGFRCAEVGKIMGKSEATTQTLVSRARKALKEKLLEEEFDYENL
jgi:RNA polymerase sigma-70 factor (ECF subfamily)